MQQLIVMEETEKAHLVLLESDEFNLPVFIQCEVPKYVWGSTFLLIALKLVHSTSKSGIWNMFRNLFTGGLNESPSSSFFVPC